MNKHKSTLSLIIIFSLGIIVFLAYHFISSEVKKDKSIVDILQIYNVPHSAELMLQTDGPIFHYQTRFLSLRTVYMLGRLVKDIPNALEMKNQGHIKIRKFFIPEKFHNTLIDTLKEYNIKITGNEKEKTFSFYSCANNSGDILEIDIYSVVRLDSGWSLTTYILPHNIFIIILNKR